MLLPVNRARCKTAPVHGQSIYGARAVVTGAYLRKRHGKLTGSVAGVRTADIGMFRNRDVFSVPGHGLLHICHDHGCGFAMGGNQHRGITEDGRQG